MATPPQDHPEAEDSLEVSPYIPAPYLYSGSVLTAPQLVSYFHDFYNSLSLVSCAPGYVFERLVANLNAVFTAAIESERLRHNAALQKSNEENEILQQSCGQLKSQIAKLEEEILKSKVQGTGNESDVVNNRIIGIGSFHTSEQNPPDQACTRASTISFVSPYSAPPAVLVGLNMLNIGGTANLNLSTYSHNIQKDRFDLHTDAGRAKIYDIGYTWLEVAKNNPDFQFGSVRTPRDPPAAFTDKITFKNAFSAPPRVVVWLSGFDLSRDRHLRLYAYGNDVTRTGFTIHLGTWCDTKVCSAAARWVAYPADMMNISSGAFAVSNVRGWERAILKNSAYINFDKNTFTSPPRILLAINKIDFNNSHETQVKVKASDISAAGMTWHIDSWGSCIMCNVGVSYIALG